MKLVDIEAQARPPVPAEKSLYDLLGRARIPFPTPAGLAWPRAFEQIRTSKARLDDDAVIEALYRQFPKAVSLRTVFGTEKVNDAKNAFRAARREAFFVFVQPLSLETLDQSSYPGTYRYIDVAKLFLQNTTAKNRNLVARRVQTTAQMMMYLVYGNTNFTSGFVWATRSIATARVLGKLHVDRVIATDQKNRSRRLYNQGSAAWTLLTFAYFVAKAWRRKTASTTGGSWLYSYDEDAWYRFWAITGSAMGIDTDLLPLNHDEATQLHQAFLDAKLAVPAGHQPGGSAPIFDAYNDKAEPTRGEYLALLKWLPSYALLQVPRFMNWVPYGPLATYKLASFLGNKLSG